MSVGIWSAHITMNKHLHRTFLYFSAFVYVSIVFYITTTSSIFWSTIHSIRYPRHNITTTTTLTTLPRAIPRVLLVIGVLSRLDALERRMALRATWFQNCNDKRNHVICTIFTDFVGNSTKDVIYFEEKEKYPGLVHMPFKGINFGLRLVWMFEYFTNRYKFDFFLRVDDDYFLCLDRLLNELSHRPKHGLYWGWVHCAPNIVRVDEGFMILTHDIVNEALSKFNTTLMCSAFGDQTVPLWIGDSRLNVTWFVDNDRIAHQAAGYERGTYEIPELCSSYLAIHRAYPNYMYKYWLWAEQKSMFTLQLGNLTQDYFIPEIPIFRQRCPLSTEFHYTAFYSKYYSVPRLCKNISQFNDAGTFRGREGK